MSTVEVCFVRHGESVANADGVWQGQGDSPLNERGRAQATALAGVLRGGDYDLIVTSDLSRAADTAKAVGGAIEHDPAWREIDVGAWEGLTMEQVIERFPEQILALKKRKTFSVGGGESWPEVFRRVDDALELLRRRLPKSGRALVFTHGGIIASVAAGLLGARGRWPWPLGRMRNTGRTTVRFSDRGIELVGHNDDSHVPGALRKRYEPRPDQVVVRMTSSNGDKRVQNPAGLDFNSAIKVAHTKGAGGWMSVFGTSQEIAETALRSVQPSVKEFRFVEPAEGVSAELLISETHRMVLDYGLRKIQI